MPCATRVEQRPCTLPTITAHRPDAKMTPRHGHTALEHDGLMRCGQLRIRLPGHALPTPQSDLAHRADGARHLGPGHRHEVRRRHVREEFHFPRLPHSRSASRQVDGGYSRVNPRSLVDSRRGTRVQTHLVDARSLRSFLEVRNRSRRSTGRRTASKPNGTDTNKRWNRRTNRNRPRRCETGLRKSEPNPEPSIIDRMDEAGATPASSIHVEMRSRFPLERSSPSQRS